MVGTHCSTLPSCYIWPQPLVLSQMSDEFPCRSTARSPDAAGAAARVAAGRTRAAAACARARAIV